jgi:type IV pilus assembly protein PilV
MTRSDRAGRRQRGVGLIEVLISVLVLSIGMLGLASLQMSTLRNNQSALERGMVVVQSHSIADAMRADRAAARGGAFNLAIDAEPTGSTFAATTLIAWRANLRAVLGPEASGAVNCNGSCTITIQWNDERGLGADDEDSTNQRDDGMQTIVTVVQL